MMRDPLLVQRAPAADRVHAGAAGALAHAEAHGPPGAHLGACRHRADQSFDRDVLRAVPTHARLAELAALAADQENPIP